jgi:regulator of sigma D
MPESIQQHMASVSVIDEKLSESQKKVAEKGAKLGIEDIKKAVKDGQQEINEFLHKECASLKDEINALHFKIIEEKLRGSNPQMSEVLDTSIAYLYQQLEDFQQDGVIDNNILLHMGKSSELANQMGFEVESANYLGISLESDGSTGPRQFTELDGSRVPAQFRARNPHLLVSTYSRQRLETQQGGKKNDYHSIVSATSEFAATEETAKRYKKGPTKEYEYPEWEGGNNFYYLLQALQEMGVHAASDYKKGGFEQRDSNGKREFQQQTESSLVITAEQVIYGYKITKVKSGIVRVSIITAVSVE